MYTHIVQYYETDKMGLTHHSNYIRWMEEARVDFLEKVGHSYAVMEEKGVISPVVSVSCSYKNSTTFTDRVEIEVKVKEVSAVRLTLSYVMTCNGKTVAEAESVHCFLNREGKPLKITRDLPDFVEALNQEV
ncbi:MAG: acyl-CoA thioesterase [Lachnospiraceae bacterium]|nr:acyl-CoA thioesterase [Lachnospiraceae bacterium]